MNYDGIIVGAGTFLIIGLLHPVVIKAEYYFGKRVWPIFLVLGAASIELSLIADSSVLSSLMAVLGFSLLWTIRELFEQEERVRKGWYPANPNKGNSRFIRGNEKLKKLLLFICGWLLLAIAAIGVFLPVLPTTPLVILAATCFSFSSKKAYGYILKSRFFGPYIENYRTKQGVSVGVKVRGIVMLWALLLLSAVLMRTLWSSVLFTVIGIGVTIHLLMLKTKRPEDRADVTSNAKAQD